VPALALQRDAHVLQHGQMREHGRDLERAHQPRRAMSAGFAGDVVAVEEDGAAVGVRNLVSRLKQVVLPAPFGPISAWMVPRAFSRLSIARDPFIRAAPCAVPVLSNPGIRPELCIRMLVMRKLHCCPPFMRSLQKL
jgi:hypothetical protein